jgi:hypothetical protein
MASAPKLPVCKKAMPWSYRIQSLTLGLTLFHLITLIVSETFNLGEDVISQGGPGWMVLPNLVLSPICVVRRELTKSIKSLDTKIEFKMRSIISI